MYDILNSLDVKPYNDKRLNLKSLTISAMDAGRDLLEVLRVELSSGSKKHILSIASTQVKLITHLTNEYDRATWKVYKKLENMRELFIPQAKLDALFDEKRAVVSDALTVAEQLKDAIAINVGGETPNV